MTTYIPSLTLPSSIFSNSAASIMFPIAIGTGIGFAMSPSQTQKTYGALKQPPLRPPPYVFGPVWTVLYGLMGYAANRAWHTGSLSLNPVTRDMARHGATLYTIQLALNYLWTPLFFGLKRPVLATADILALTGVTGYMTYLWGQVDPVAGWALAPYMAWLGFASYLCIGTAHLNGWDLSGKETNGPPKRKE